MSENSPTPNARSVLNTIADRRVTRVFEDTTISEEMLKELAVAAYWAPSGGARRPVKLVAVRDSLQVRRIVAVSPGIIGNPVALLVLCADWGQAEHLEVDDPRDTQSTHVDIGAAMENVLLASQALGLGTCPVMSFHRSSVQQILGTPSTWSPLVIVAVGHAKNPLPSRSRNPKHLDEFLHWDVVTGDNNG